MDQVKETEKKQNEKPLREPGSKGFERGNPGGPGRPKGLPNKLSGEAQTAILESFLNDPDKDPGTFLKELKNSQDGEERKRYDRYVFTVLPRIQTVTVSGDPENPLIPAPKNISLQDMIRMFGLEPSITRQ